MGIEARIRLTLATFYKYRGCFAIIYNPMAFPACFQRSTGEKPIERRRENSGKYRFTEFEKTEPISWVRLPRKNPIRKNPPNPVAASIKDDLVRLYTGEKAAGG
jgi:hypothetical protein